MHYEVHHANFLDWLQAYEGAPFHAMFSDWPYNLESITKRFGKNGSAPAKFGRDGAFARQSRGFMSATWDTDLAYRTETWELILERGLLHPGAFTLGFSHPRKQHRLASAQEEAGFIINPAFYSYHSGTVMEVPAQLGWCYGSGKPNGTRVDLGIDKRAGAEREVIGTKKMWGHNAGDGSDSFYANGYQATTGQVRHETITAPATPLARTWDGWQYGSPLGPEIEPIIVAQVPYDGAPLDSIPKYGSGAMNIAYGKSGKVGGRFPGNLILHHHPECKMVGWKEIQNQSGGKTGEEPSERTKNCYGEFNPVPFQAHGDENGIERVPDYQCHPDCVIPKMEEQAGGPKAHYFFQADWSFEVMERLAMADRAFYQGKVSARERNAGCSNLPLLERRRVNPGGLEREPRFANTFQHNNHPTLKSIKLCAWLAGLVLPPPEYAPRRIAIPCSGTGSEMIGCLLAGWDEVVGIEMTNEPDKPYVDISLARLEFFSEWIKWGHTDVESILNAAQAELEQQQAGALQLGMF
jgi:hypothetical protein